MTRESHPGPHQKPAKIPVLRGQQVTYTIPVRVLRAYALALCVIIVVILGVLGYVVWQSNQRHDQRVHDQRTTSDKIDVLACGEVKLLFRVATGSPPVLRYAQNLYRQYDCAALHIPAFPNDSTPHPSSSHRPVGLPHGPTPPPANPTPTPGPTPAVPSNIALPAHPSTPVGVPTVTRTVTTRPPPVVRTTPHPSRSSTPTPHPSPSVTPLINLPTLTCTLVGLLCDS